MLDVNTCPTHTIILTHMHRIEMNTVKEFTARIKKDRRG
jgi:hypothetical protein